MTGTLDRRELLSRLATAALAASPLGRAAGALALPGPAPGRGSGPSRAVVAFARREGMVAAEGPAAGTVAVERLREALGAAVARAGDEATPVAALRRLFRPGDVVGIKLNCMGGRSLSPRPETVFALVRWLREAGVDPDRIIVWERTGRELRGAGFVLGSGPGVKVMGTDGDWEEKVREWGPSASRFSRLLVEDVTAVINLGVLKDHGLAGVSAGLKNWYGVVHNPNKLHAEGCAPYVPYLAASPLVNGKLRLTVVDAVTAQCHGGPGYAPSWAWPLEGFLATTDAVAADAVAWGLIEGRRREKGLRTLAAEGREPRFIAASERLGLGVADPRRIEVARV